MSDPITLVRYLSRDNVYTLPTVGRGHWDEKSVRGYLDGLELAEPGFTADFIHYDLYADFGAALSPRWHARLGEDDVWVVQQIPTPKAPDGESRPDPMAYVIRAEDGWRVVPFTGDVCTYWREFAPMGLAACLRVTSHFDVSLMMSKSGEDVAWRKAGDVTAELLGEMACSEMGKL
jgi:hypothetical protein